MGQVYVANTSPVTVLFQVNGAAIPTGWPAQPGGPPYMVSAPLVKHPEGGQFGLGPNTLDAQFTDQEGGSYSFHLTLDDVSVNANFIVYVFRGYAALLSQFGYVLATSGTPVPPPPSPASATLSAGPP